MVVLFLVQCSCLLISFSFYVLLKNDRVGYSQKQSTMYVLLRVSVERSKAQGDENL